MKKPALIFDLDGTLWDSAESVAAAWTAEGKKFLGEDFLLTKEDVYREMGKTMDQIIDDVAPNATEPTFRANLSKHLFQAENDYLVEHPGTPFAFVRETLEQLKRDGYRLYIVSNCQWGYIETFLPLMPEGLFSGHLCWSDTRSDKHVTIRLMMEKSGEKEAIYIGDTLGDEKETHLAGLPFIHAAYGFGKSENPEASISSIQELPAVLGTME